jgi:hypothetical protein
MKHRAIFYYLVLFLVAVVVRLYHIDAPVADWHSWRQSDTAAVARNFLRLGVDPLDPRYDDLSNIQSGKDNPQGYRMVEFPIYQLLAVGVVRLVPQISVVVALRLVTILASAGTAVLLVVLFAPSVGLLAAMIAGFVYAILPYSIYYGRVILPEPLAVFFSIASLVLLAEMMARIGKRRWLFFVASIVCFAGALLVKPTAGFLMLPALPILLPRRRITAKRVFVFLVYGALSLVPLLLWRKWILQFPEGIPVYDWLLNAGNIRFKGAWFHWLFAERLANLILGYWLMIPLGVGAMIASRKGRSMVWTLVFGTLLYLTIFAAGNVQHDYYQIVTLPSVCILVGLGLGAMLTHEALGRWYARWTVVAVAVLMGLAFSFFTIRTYYWVNRQDIVDAGRMADKLLPPNAKVIAPYNGDTTFLFQTGRQGWPLGFDIQKHIEMGATHYVTVSPTDNDLETRDLANMYTVLVRNDHFAIIDLTKPKIDDKNVKK